MKLNRFVCMLGLICLAGICPGQSLLLLIEESQVNWTGSAAIGSYQLGGSLTTEKGFLEIGEGLVMKGLVVLDMKSLVSETAGLCDHLRKKDFFHVKKYPQASFELSRPCPLIEGKAVVEGILAIRGVQKQVQIPVELALEGELIELKARLVIDRTEYGMRYNSPSFFENLGNQAIANEMVVDVRLIFIPE